MNLVPGSVLERKTSYSVVILYIKNQEIFIGFEDRCLSFTGENGRVRVNNETQYCCSICPYLTDIIYQTLRTPDVDLATVKPVLRETQKTAA